MGNNQSTPQTEAPPKKLAKAPKVPNKLTKPKTNTTKSNLVSLSVPSTPSRRSSQNRRLSRFSSFDGVVGVETHKDDPPKVKEKKRTSIFRSRSSQRSVKRLEVNTNIEPEIVRPNPVDGWPSSNFMPLEPPVDEPYSANLSDPRPPAPNPRNSLAHRQSYTHQPRLSLIVEQLTPTQTPQPQLDEGSKRFSRLWGSIKQEESGSSPSSPIPERADPEPIVYAPIRRRSLLQPGIATRNSYGEPWSQIRPGMSSRHSYTEPNSRETLPSQLQAPSTTDQLKRYYHGPRKAPPMPLSDYVAPAPQYAEDRSGPRALTPSEADYRHIGAFKLGTLRITNGAASPTPSETSFKKSAEDEYPTNGGQRRASSESHHSLLPPGRRNTLAGTNEIIKPPWMAIRAESPLRQEPYAEFARLNVKTSADDIKHSLVQSFPSTNFKATSNNDSPTKALELAEEYMQDIARSPFSFEQSPSPPATPVLQTTSKHTALEDDLFAPEPEMLTPEESLDPTPTSSIDSGYGTGEYVPKPQQKARKQSAPKPLSKADSGYSSNVSLRSFNGNTSESAVLDKELPPTPPKESRPRMESLPSASAEKTVRGRYSLLGPQFPSMPARQAPPIPQEQCVSSGSERVDPAPSLPEKAVEQRWAAAESRARMAAHQRQISLPGQVQAAQPTHSLSMSDRSASSSRWGEQRPQSVQPIHTNGEYEIPPVSAEAERKLKERVSRFLEQNFQNTANELQNSSSKETLGTIVSARSAGSQENHKPVMARMHSTLPSIPDHPVDVGFDMKELIKPKNNRRFSYQAPVPAPVNSGPLWIAKTRQSLQMTLPPPLQEIYRQENSEFENHLTSFENISSSLGESPYDHALRAMSETPKSKARAVTGKLEAAARERFALNRSTSTESSRPGLHHQRSYDSIANQNPYIDSVSSSRQSSRQPSMERLRDRSRSRESMTRRSMPVIPDRLPFSMNVKRASLMTVQPPQRIPSSSTSWSQGPVALIPAPSQLAPIPAPSQLPPRRAPPAPPANQRQIDPLRVNPVHAAQEAWAVQREYGVPQRQLVGNDQSQRQQQEVGFQKSLAIPPRTSSNPIRRNLLAGKPLGAQQQRESTDKQQTQPNLLSRKSLDIPRARAAASVDFQAPKLQHPQRKPVLSHHISIENAQLQWRYDSGYDYGGQLTLETESTAYSRSNDNQQTPSAPNKEDEGYNKAASSSQDDEYDPYSYIQQAQGDNKDPLPQTIHSNSTSDMLVLDQYAGGMGYGFERTGEGNRHGFVGSAGMRCAGESMRRKSVVISKDYGVDFSDVPMFLTQVRS